MRQSLMVLCGRRAKGPVPESGLRPTRTLHTACGRRSLLRAFTLVSRQLARLWRGLRSGPVRRPVGLERMGLRPVTSARRLGLGIPLSKMCPWMCAGLRPFTPARRRSFGVPSSSKGLGLSVDGLHVFSRTSAWCDFCGLPFLRAGRETVSHLVGDGTAASEGGPQAAGIAVCECGGGWA